jgi:NAD(P)-dependent dehydrogenase (short-subunit alcohol dehydrogenase family)
MKGKNAIITGSTQGIGEAIARKLISNGLSNLIICGRNDNKGKKLSDELTELGCNTIYVKSDLSKLEDCNKIIDTAINSFKTIDILVNSAGTTDRGTLIDTSPELFDKIFSVNVRAPFFLMSGVVQNMIKTNNSGSILNIISMSSHGGQPKLSAYSTSKGALATLTKNAAFAYMRNNIRVNGLNIGWSDTPGEHSIQLNNDKAPDNWLIEAEKAQPMGRLIKPKEIAEVSNFILSAKSGMMTGVIMDYDQSVHGANYTPPRP